MKIFSVFLICTAVVVGLQLPKDKIALSNSLEIKQQIQGSQKNFAEDVSENSAAEKNVDSTTESTKKKK